MNAEQPRTEELRALQVEREHAERDAAHAAQDGAEERTHERRADKAAYLAEKLDEQAEALDS
jgi:hypothetical protein